MKILIYAHSFPPSKGGLQYSNLEIVKGLKFLGNDIRVITCYNKGIRQFVSNFSFPVRILPKWHFTSMNSVTRKGLLNWLFAPVYLFIILKEIISFKPDIGFITDETANAFWGVICRVVKIPYVSYCSVPVFNRYNKYSNNKYLRTIIRAIMKKIKCLILYSYKRSKAILVVSNSTKEQVIQSLPQIQKKIDLIPRSIDDVFFETQTNKDQIELIKRKMNINENHIIFLSVSKLTPNKGIDDVIKSINELASNKRQRVKYIVLGSGKYLVNLKKMVTQFKLENNVIFHKAVDHLDLISFYNMCDIFVLPSRRGISESFGRVFAEAAARYKASIGVNEGGMTDIIEHGKTGFLIKSGDIHALQKTIEYVLDNIEEIRKMGLNARYKAEKSYKSYAIANKFQNCFEKSIYEISSIL
jgi:glycosyltransferase involved in cell wall biosynthesis